jgi:hypothetical protein
MKRKILLIGILLLVLLITALGLFVWQINSVVASLKPQIEQQASEALGTPVSVGALELSFFPSIAVRATGVTLGAASPESEHNEGNPKRSQQAHFDQVLLRVGLSALLSGKLQIQELLLEQPAITIVRRKGKLLFPGVSQKPKRKDSAAVQPPPNIPEGSAPGAGGTAATSPLLLELDGFRIRQGTLIFDDQDAKQSITLDKLDLALALSLQAQKLSLKNISVAGQLPGSMPLTLQLPDVTVDLASQEFASPKILLSLPGLEASTSFSAAASSKRMDLDLRALTLQLQPFSNFLGSLEPKLKQQFDALRLGGSIQASGRAGSKGTVYEGQATINLQQVALSLGALAFSQLSAPLLVHASPARATLDAQSLSFTLNKENFSCTLAAVLERQALILVQGFNCSAFGGKSTLEASHALDSKQLESGLTLTDLDLTQMLTALAPAQAGKLRGTLRSFEAKLQSNVGPQLLPKLKGRGRFELRDGALLGVNLAAETLRSVSKLPFLADSLYNALPKELQQELAGDVTDIKQLQASFEIADSKVQFKELLLESKLFTLSAKGWASFAQELSLSGSITFSAALSKSIVAAVKELSSLQDQEGRIQLPLAVNGTLPKLIVIPDPVALFNKLGRARVERQAEKLLGKILGGKDADKEKNSEIIKGLGDLFKR